ncbi:hypothetical protein HTY52_12765 [Cupriavidus taiwanensis]|uniref:hypothetical protein n=1 Tax=Cupriavidus taiwanensis TaxID=164546 RepID=UPI001572E135|nr:hypothetical protein [Cupriavidus taiwanensis]NSX14947.1 hypothetical protein [Cupriavidus taiwanensis]
MIASFFVHDSDGRILRYGICVEEDVPLQAREGEVAVEGKCDIMVDYVKDGEVTPRPAMPVTLTGQTLSNVPVPAVVVIDGTRYDCTEDHVELDLPYQKTYAITVEAFPYLDAKFTLTL